MACLELVLTKTAEDWRVQSQYYPVHVPTMLSAGDLEVGERVAVLEAGRNY